MKLLIVVSLVALSSAAQLPTKGYLPPSQGNGLGVAEGYGAGIGADGNGNTRAQQAIERNAEVLRLDQQVGEDGFRYAYETSNGIRAEEGGNAERTQGAYEYKGDDGLTYSVTFTAGVDGFQAQGAHLPVPPPTPQEILLALEQNARDEAAGIFDDGLYRPDANEGGRGGPGIAGQAGSSQVFGSANHQGSFNANSGYSY